MCYHGYNVCVFLYYTVPGVAPAMISATPDQRSINVSWMMLECQDRRGNITMYEVRYINISSDSINQTENTASGDDTSLLEDGSGEFTTSGDDTSLLVDGLKEFTTSGDDTSLLVDGLEEFTNYTIEVRAYTAVGPGPYSSPIEVMTLTDGKHIVYVCIGRF